MTTMESLMKATNEPLIAAMAETPSAEGFKSELHFGSIKVTSDNHPVPVYIEREDGTWAVKIDMRVVLRFTKYQKALRFAERYAHTATF